MRSSIKSARPSTRDMNKSWREHAYHALLWVVVLVYFSPVAWIILSAFKTKNDLLATPPKWLFTPTLANFVDLFHRPDFWPTFLHSILISLGSVFVAIIVSFLAAYSLSRFRPYGTDFILFLLLSVRMVPAAAVVVPVFLMYVALGWKDTFWGMLLFYTMFSIPFSLWILKGFIDGISMRYDETGLTNRASRLHVIFKIILPQVKPGLVAALIFNLLFVWNEFLFNFVLGGRTSTMVPVLLVNSSLSDGGVDWTFVAALSSLYLLPPIVMIYFFQKYLLVGMTFGTVRGEV